MNHFSYFEEQGAATGVVLLFPSHWGKMYA
jgi:hypothetical protein